jgi:hypothetical protein
MRFSGMRKCGLVFFVGALAGFAFLAVEICFFTAKVENRESDVAIVLGAAVWGDEPSPVFLERIKHAVDLRKTDAIGKIIFTGGVCHYA